MKFVFAFIFVALAWAAGFVFPELPMAVPVLTTVVVVLGMVLWFALRWGLALLRARRLETGLAQSAGPSDGMRPEVRAQIEEMQAEFQKALRTLKSSKLARHGRGALAALPWYVIIGPPGSGKSTLLRNSGLKFPYMSAKRGAVRGGAGTRNCDWWLSNEGILLDTAGRWATEDDDQDEWLSFLDLLRKTRRGRPLNGILVSIGADELLKTDSEDIAPLARKLRERIDEVLTRLSVKLPVYMLITKCDLVGGFVETFGGLNEKDRGQLWGLTLPLEVAASARPELFVERLTRLVDVLEGRSVVALKREGRPEVARKIYEFPQQFEALCPALVDLVNELFTENSFQDSPVLRGVYFTSATQEGRPIDQVVERMARAIGLAPSQDYQPMLKAKSYFLRDMFRSVIFPDQNVAVEGEAAIKRRRVLAIAGAASAFVAAFAIAMMPVTAYSGNLGFARAVRAYADALAASRGPLAAEPLPGPGLEEQFERSQELLERRVAGPAASMTWGFYQGDKLYSALARVVRDHAVRQVLFRDVELMSAFVAQRKEREFRDASQALRLHLFATAPKAAGEPHPGDSRAKERLAEGRALLVARWKAHLAGRRVIPSARSEQVLGDAMELYLREGRDDRELWEPRNNGAVERVREPLCQIARRDPIGHITRDAAFENFDVLLGNVVGGSISLFQNDARLPGAFTHAGWDGPRGVKAQLLARQSSGGAGETGTDWALGGCDLLSADEAAQSLGKYLGQYEEHWRSFLSDISPKEGVDLAQSRDLLRRYVEERPLAALWETLGQNVLLTQAPAQSAVATGIKKFGNRVAELFRKSGDPAGRPTGPDAELQVVDQRFARLLAFGTVVKEGVPSSLDAYYERLGAVSKAARAFADTQDGKALQTEVAGAKRDIEDIIVHSQTRGWDPVLRKLLLTPLEGLHGKMAIADAESANRRWCDAVVLPFAETLGDKYPFKAEGTDASIGMIEKYFHPKTGALWQYVNAALAADFEPGSFTAKPGASVAYRQGLGDYLRRAKAASDLFFTRGAEQFSMPVEARVYPAGTGISQIVLRIGAVPPIVYRNGPVSFQGLAGPGRDATLMVRDVRGSGPRDYELFKPGDWALLRLLDAARLTDGRDDQTEFVHAVWVEVVPGVSVGVDWRPRNLRSAFKNLSPPHAVTAGRSPCGG